ncbi:MAG: ABC transporter ATP-binding protein [Burkholderiales bacterium]
MNRQPGEILLQVDGLKTRIGEGEGAVRAVDGISFALRRGETFALLGESGCGKSMTALSLLRLLPDSGRIVSGAVRLNGEDLLALPEFAMRGVRGRRIAMVFQEPMLSLNPVFTVGEQIGEAVRLHTGLRGAAAERRVRELLDAVGIPDAERRSREYPFQLSGGMKQRVMIAMALAGDPEVLIADEPTTALDVTIQAQVLDVLREVQRRSGMALLLITHDLGIVAEMAHRVAVMYAGQIVEQASCAEFFAAPRHPYSRKLFASLPEARKRGQALAAIAGSVPPLRGEIAGCRFAPRCDWVRERCRTEAPEWRESGPEQGVRCHFADEIIVDQSPYSAPSPLPESASAAAPVLLRVDGLQVHFPVRKGLLQKVAGQVRAVDGVSLELRRGRTLALVGESGCGKTTVGKGLLQLLPPTAGQVYLDGEALVGMARAELRRKRGAMQIVFQDPYSSLNPRMRVCDILEEGMAAMKIGADAPARGRLIDALLQQVGLPPESRFRYPHEFSGGQRQRIAIARALAVNPRLIVCDEPTSALDVSVQAQILNLLKGLQDNLGLSYLFITHNLAVVEYLAHEVAVMYLGRIVESGPAHALLENPRHPYTQALLSAVPVADPAAQRQVIRLQGDLPSPLNPPAGCHFHPRCPQAMAQCRERYPEVTEFGEGHRVRCYWAG